MPRRFTSPRAGPERRAVSRLCAAAGRGGRRTVGLTLVELLIASVVLSLLAVAAAAGLHTCLQAHAAGANRSALLREGVMIMERMTSGVRNCTFLLIPNARNTSRNILAFSGTVNDDHDSYFNDPLFPRVDENPPEDMNNDGKAGIAGIDDDGDGLTDETDAKDDDEDKDQGASDSEDKLDGVDNDGDGNIDEDCRGDSNDDGKPGLKDMGDDGDGAKDEGDHNDDDEDGVKDEDPLNALLYIFNSATKTLTEQLQGTAAVTLSTRVTSFVALYEPPAASHDPRVVISLTLTGDDGEKITFSEYAYPRNITQKTGKKVR